MAKKVIPAKLENLDEAIDFIKEGAESLDFDDKKMNQIQLASEEVLVNIIHYAYPEDMVKEALASLPQIPE